MRPEDVEDAPVPPQKRRGEGSDERSEQRHEPHGPGPDAQGNQQEGQEAERYEEPGREVTIDTRPRNGRGKKGQRDASSSGARLGTPHAEEHVRDTNDVEAPDPGPEDLYRGDREKPGEEHAEQPAAARPSDDPCQYDAHR